MAAKRIKIDNASSKFRRQSQKREQKVIRCSVLIVCEGTKTEPNYFEAFAEKQQGVIVYDIEVKGLSGNFWLVSFKISYLCLPLFYETRTTPSCHPSGCAYRQL